MALSLSFLAQTAERLGVSRSSPPTPEKLVFSHIAAERGLNGLALDYSGLINCSFIVFLEQVPNPACGCHDSHLSHEMMQAFDTLHTLRQEEQFRLARSSR